MKPERPSDPRPNNEPYYIKKTCPKCGEKLKLSQLLENKNTPKDEIWYDEWECPTCREGLHLDWPEELIEELKKRAEEVKTKKWTNLD